MDEAGDILQVVALFSAFYIVPAIIQCIILFTPPRFFSYIGSLVGRIIADNIVTWCAIPICMYLTALVEAKTVGGILWHLFFFLVLTPFFTMPFWAIGGRVLVALYGTILGISEYDPVDGFAGRFFDDKAAYLLFRSTMFAVILNTFVLYAKNIWEFDSQCYLITFTSFFSFSAFYWDTFLTSKALSIQIE
jgi:hypothetical protein